MKGYSHFHDKEIQIFYVFWIGVKGQTGCQNEGNFGQKLRRLFKKKLYSPKLGPKTDQTRAWQIDTHHTSYPRKVW